MSELEVAGPRTTERLVTLESALRIINTLAASAANERPETVNRIIAEIRRQATEALR